MSHFGAKLEELLDRNKLSAAELSRASRINDGLISRWINARQTFVSHEDLETLTAVISKNPRECAELIRAHLQDECVGKGSHLVEVHILGTGTETKDATTPYRVVPPLKVQRALEILGRESVVDADVRNLLLSMANLCEPKPKREEVSSKRKRQIDEELTRIVQGDKTPPP